MSAPFIRPYRPSDFDAAAHICRATLPPSMAGVEFAERLCAYVWTHPYTHLSPRTCFVLDDGGGRAVGYCIGCVDVRDLLRRYGEYREAVLDVSEDVGMRAVGGDGGGGEEGGRSRSEGIAGAAAQGQGGTDTEERLLRWVYDQRGLLEAGREDIAAEGITATMHIDLLEGWQGCGWGRRMVEVFVGSVREESEARRERGEDDGDDVRGVWIGVAPDNERVVGFYERLGFVVRKRAGDICMVREL